MIKEILQFYREASHIDASALELIGSPEESTNDDDSEIFLTAQGATGNNPVNQSRAGQYTKLAFTLANVDEDIALADFALVAKPSKNSNIVTLISGATWGTVGGILKHKVGALNTLAAGATAYAYVDIGPAYSIAFQAQSGGADLITNGAFTGNANSWTLGSGWAYGTNNVAATAADTTLSQAKSAMSGAGALWVSGAIYEITFTISGYSAGNLLIGTTANPDQYLDTNGDTIQIGDGTYTAKVESDGAAGGLIFTGVGFTGVIDTVTMKRCANIVVTGSLSE